MCWLVVNRALPIIDIELALVPTDPLFQAMSDLEMLPHRGPGPIRVARADGLVESKMALVLAGLDVGQSRRHPCELHDTRLVEQLGHLLQEGVMTRACQEAVDGDGDLRGFRPLGDRSA